MHCMFYHWADLFVFLLLKSSLPTNPCDHFATEKFRKDELVRRNLTLEALAKLIGRSGFRMTSNLLFLKYHFRQYFIWTVSSRRHISS